MFCGKCGTKINDGDSFCTNCGAEVLKNNDNNSKQSLSDQVKKSKIIQEYPEDTLGCDMDGIFFGKYPQSDIKVEDALYEEPIEWLILEKQEDKVLLMSKYILDCVLCNKNIATEYKESNLREWLNGHFLDTAFSKDELKRIIVHKTKYYDNIYKDKIFCLTTYDTAYYFNYSKIDEESDNHHKGLNNKRLTSKRTHYAKIMGVSASGDLGFGKGDSWDSGNSYFWLLWEDKSWDGQPYVDFTGCIHYFGGNGLKFVGVRPAMWVKI